MAGRARAAAAAQRQQLVHSGVADQLHQRAIPNDLQPSPVLVREFVVDTQFPARGVIIGVVLDTVEERGMVLNRGLVAREPGLDQ